MKTLYRRLIGIAAILGMFGLISLVTESTFFLVLLRSVVIISGLIGIVYYGYLLFWAFRPRRKKPRP